MVAVSAGSLERRIGQARAALERRDLCELRCGVNRLARERGQCGLGVESRCYRRHMSLAEELELLPSYMVYLGSSREGFAC